MVTTLESDVVTTGVRGDNVHGGEVEGGKTDAACLVAGGTEAVMVILAFDITTEPIV